MDENKPRSGPLLVTQSAPTSEPHTLSSSNSYDDDYEPVSPDTIEDAGISETQDTSDGQILIGYVSPPKTRV